MGTRYRSLSGAIIDPEKQPRQLHRPSHDYSDRLSPTPHAHPDRGRRDLLPPPSPYNPRPGPASFAYHLPRRRFSRYFTLAITLLLFVFISYLVRSSWASRAEVRLGLKKPPPPPPAWEAFPFLKRYHGGIRTLVSRDANRAVREYPVGDDEEVRRLQEMALRSKEEADRAVGLEKGFQKRDAGLDEGGEEGRRPPTVGFPTGVRFNPYAEARGGEFEPPQKCWVDWKTNRTVPLLLGYEGVPKGFPDPVMGSYEVLGLRDEVCFERYGRLGPYGYGYSRKFGGSGAGMDGEKEGSEQVWDGDVEIDYREIDWAEAQERCARANAHRFRTVSKKDTPNNRFVAMATAGSEQDKTEETDDKVGKTTIHGKQYMNRTAVVIRTWWDYNYDQEDMFYLRALINELSIQSGGEYTVHFLVHVKDDNKQIWADEDVYQQVLADALPAEFRGMGTLWSERQMGLIYGGVAESFYRDLPVHGAYRSTYMPVQYFAHMHPEYDFFWHWEMDARYTGNFYHLFDKVSKWAQKQPRKGLWERNGRFYVPSEHGSWDDFRQLVRVQTEHGTAHQANIYSKFAKEAGTTNPLDEGSRHAEPSVWGPVRPTGEGDTVDLPDLDPQPPTTYESDAYQWGVDEAADLITFNPLFDPHNTNWILAEDVTGYNTTATFPPRRTAIITASRLSRRLLATMHRETALQRHTMFSEMWPGSCALHHGYKAVYAPHPVYVDRAWPTSYLAAVFNNGRNGAAGGARTSVFSDERQHNFRGSTWYYDAGFAPNLWRRWLGFRVDNDGGEEWEVANEGRMCLPPMLLHPVKQVDLIYEHREGE